MFIVAEIISEVFSRLK